VVVLSLARFLWRRWKVARSRSRSINRAGPATVGGGGGLGGVVWCGGCGGCSAEARLAGGPSARFGALGV
jgi:hypothetical protein